MSSSAGLTCNTSRISCCGTPKGGFSLMRGSTSISTPLFYPGKLLKSDKLVIYLGRKYKIDVVDARSRRKVKVKSAMNASFGDASENSSVVFPRINVKDPYKRLGISKEASEEEIQAARNFLINQYAGHKPSVDAIESAHDKIIMDSFYARRRPKIDMTKKVRDVTQSRFIRAVTSRFQSPSRNVILKTAIAFAVLGALTVLFPTEEGPTLQVAISLIVAIYFIHERLKSKVRAFLYGIGGFIVSWLLGTFLMVSVIPPLPFLRGPRGFEVASSLISYIFLWVSSTYLK